MIAKWSGDGIIFSRHCMVASSVYLESIYILYGVCLHDCNTILVYGLKKAVAYMFGCGLILVL